MAIIYAYAEHWVPIDITINGGFTGKLKVNLSEPLKSRTVNNLALSLVDNDGKKVRLDAPLKLYIRGSKIALLAKDTDLWREDVEMPLMMGTSNLLPIDIKPRTWVADTGMISVILTTPQGYSVYDDTVHLPILPPWYVPLIMAMIGGLACSFGQFVRAHFNKTRRMTAKSLLGKAAVSAIAGLTAGLLAYLLAAWNVLGIKIDTTSLKGFVILGFLFSYVGVDVVLRAASTKRS